ATALPGPVRTTANPPPAMLPAVGWVTASANASATAASTALPPAARMSWPTWLAAGDSDTARKCLPGPTVAGSIPFAGALPYSGSVGRAAGADAAAVPTSATAAGAGAAAAGAAAAGARAGAAGG